MPSEDSQIKDMKSFVRSMQIKAANAVVNAKVIFQRVTLFLLFLE